MKTKLIYLLIFFSAFFGISGILMVLDQKYENIFDFNFTPINEVDSLKYKNLEGYNFNKIKEYINKELKPAIIDSLDKKYFKTKVDTLILTVVKDPMLKKSLADAKVNFTKLRKDIEKKSREIQQLKLTVKVKKDSLHKAWLKSTVKLYESMDPQIAAKLIEKISDNEAKEIIYTMKNQKAAEILSYLKPEKVITLTKAKQ